MLLCSGEQAEQDWVCQARGHRQHDQGPFSVFVERAQLLLAGQGKGGALDLALAGRLGQGIRILIRGVRGGVEKVMRPYIEALL